MIMRKDVTIIIITSMTKTVTTTIMMTIQAVIMPPTNTSMKVAVRVMIIRNDFPIKTELVHCW